MLNLDFWDYSVKQVCGDFHTKPHSSLPFIGDIQLQNHGGLEVAHIETNALQIERNKTPSLQQNDEYCFVILQKKGVMGFSNAQSDEFSLQPGEIALIDSSTRYCMHPQGLIKQMSIHMPKCILDNFGKRHHGAFQKLPQNPASSKMLLTILRQLDHPQLSYMEGEGQAIQHAISAFIQPNVGGDWIESSVSLKETARQHILRLLPEENLCPERLAQEMGISKRSLYRLFADERVSVARMILQLRIDQCCKELAESKMLKQPISLTDVAFRWGFSDTSQFSRAFKRIKGVSPSVWRDHLQ